MVKEQGSSNLVQNIGHKGPVLRSRCIGPGRARTQIPFNSFQLSPVLRKMNSAHISITYCLKTISTLWFYLRLGLQSGLLSFRVFRLISARVFHLSRACCMPYQFCTLPCIFLFSYKNIKEKNALFTAEHTYLSLIHLLHVSA